MARRQADRETPSQEGPLFRGDGDGSTFGRTEERRQAEELADALPPLLVEAERVASTVAPGIHGRRRVGSGETFWQFRRYEVGDSATQIDWRQSARSDRLYVREHEWEAAETVWIWRDGSPSMDYRSTETLQTKLNRATVLALAAATLLVRAGERVAPFGTGIAPTTGRTALRRMAHLYMDGASAESLPPLDALPRFSRLVLIGDFLSDPEALSRLIRHFAAAGVHGHMLQVLDPAEEDLPFRGRTEFEGIEEPARLLFGRAESVRAEYQHRLHEHRAALAAIARHFGWTFTSHRTDRPPQTALLTLHAALSGAPLHAHAAG